MVNADGDLLAHPMWPTLLGYLYVRRGRDGINGPRHRIEVNKNAPLTVFDIEVSCAYCGQAMKPVRVDARGAWTLNLSCPLSVRVKCARMPETTRMASMIRARIRSEPPAASLFDEAAQQ